MAAEFWCEPCQRWTSPDAQARQEGRMVCSNCGEYYGCGECGYEIDRRGNCTRNASGPPEVVGFCPAGTSGRGE